MEVELYGLPVDTHRREHRTKPIVGPHPVWGEESKEFAFRKVSKFFCSAMESFSVYD